MRLQAGVLALIAVGCGGGADSATKNGVEVRDFGTRAVVIGIDGADWKIIEALQAKNALPNLTRLQQAGTSGPIETLREMPLSPPIWTSVATGKGVAEHGISWFMVDQADGTRVPVRSHNRKVKAIWNILAESGKKPFTVGWWATYPAEDVAGGKLVSDALGVHGFGTTARKGDDGKKTHPPELFDEVAPLIPPESEIGPGYALRYLGMSPDEYRGMMYPSEAFPEPNPQVPVHLFQQYAATAEGYTNIAEKQLQDDDYDLYMLYYEQVDSFSHLFMKYAPPKLDWVDPVQQNRFKNVVSEWYRHQDELLGRLLEHIDLDTTAVFILSDHGFKSGDRRIRSEHTVDVNKAHLDHETHGVFIAAGPHIAKGQIEGASVLDLTPTVLHYLGFPVAEDMAGKVLTDVFDPEWLANHAVQTLPSYEAEVTPQQAAPDEEYSEEEAAANLEALEALGYVDGAEGQESSPELHTNTGRIYLQRGEIEKAKEEFNAALKLNPNHADALLALAQVLSLEGRVGEAEYNVKKALVRDPNSISALNQLAQLKKQQGDLPEAKRLIETALEINDSFPFVYLDYGDTLQRMGQHAEAEQAFRRVLELDPDDFKAYYNLGVIYANLGDLDKAVEHYERSISLAPQHPETAMAHNNLGTLALQAGNLEGAEQRYLQASKLSPYNLEARYNLALIYTEQGKTPEAVAMLEHAAQLQPHHEQVNVRLGWAYVAADRGEDAHRVFLLVHRLSPKNWEAELGLALIYAVSNQAEPAKKHLAAALANGGDEAHQRAATMPGLKPLLP